MNENTRTTIYYLAAICLLIGAILHFIGWFFAPYLFAIGAAGLSVCYITYPTLDMNFRQKRLHRNNIFAGLLMILSSGLMFADRKEWIPCLTIAAVLQIYSAFATPNKKE